MGWMRLSIVQYPTENSGSVGNSRRYGCGTPDFRARRVRARAAPRIGHSEPEDFGTGNEGRRIAGRFCGPAGPASVQRGESCEQQGAPGAEPTHSGGRKERRSRDFRSSATQIPVSHCKRWKGG
jgi:hypothetical protein